LTALLDAQAGIEYEGEDPPTAGADDGLAITIWNMTANGMGGMDWSGFPLMCEWLGVQDVEAVLHRLLIIKSHKPPKER
jgi:hypothetical protein